MGVGLSSLPPIVFGCLSRGETDGSLFLFLFDKKVTVITLLTGTNSENRYNFAVSLGKIYQHEKLPFDELG